MFWKKIAKIVLYINVGFGLIASIAAAVTIGRVMEVFSRSGSGIGFLIFLVGTVITLINCCVLGTICEIGDAVGKNAGGNAGVSPAADREIRNRLKSLENKVEGMVAAKREDFSNKEASSVNGDDYLDLDATVVLPESAFEEMGLVINKDRSDNQKKSESSELKRKEPVAFCVNCGAKNKTDSAFCFSCGSKL